MNGPVALGVDVIKRHFHYLANAIFVNVVHRESFDVFLLDNLFFKVVDVAETNVDQSLSVEAGLDPSKVGVALGNTSQKAKGAAVDVA